MFSLATRKGSSNSYMSPSEKKNRETDLEDVRIELVIEGIYRGIKVSCVRLIPVV